VTAPVDGISGGQVGGSVDGPRGGSAAAAVRALVADVPDPEIPVLTIDDLGVLRDVTVDDRGHVRVDITPTYSGCPAMDAIRADVEARLVAAGHADAEVRLVLSPAWTTDWMSAVGRRKLADYGIAPPSGRAAVPAGGGAVPMSGLPMSGVPVSGVPVSGVPVSLSVRCPQCGSPDTRELSRFGSTACKSLWRCLTCREPFDSFKVH
jgi:ring-1,2-phenylacetyl-CoA epoxidase subunit PaaD